MCSETGMYSVPTNQVYRSPPADINEVTEAWWHVPIDDLRGQLAHGRRLY